MLEIKLAEKKDIPQIRELALIAFPETYKEILSKEQIEYMLDWMYSEENLNKQFDSGHIYHIGEYDQKPCAYTSVEKQAPDLWHLQKIYILPQYQCKGIGKTMFEHAINFIKQTSPEAKRVELNVNRHNSAKIFYEKMGMTVATSGDFNIGNGYFMNDYIMELEI